MRKHKIPVDVDGNCVVPIELTEMINEIIATVQILENNKKKHEKTMKKTKRNCVNV